NAAVERGEVGRIHRQDHHAAETAVRPGDAQGHGNAPLVRDPAQHGVVQVEGVLRVVALLREEIAVGVIDGAGALRAGDDGAGLVDDAEDGEGRVPDDAVPGPARQIQAGAFAQVLLAGEDGNLL